MSNDQRIEVQVAANVAPLQAGMQQAVSAVQSAASGITSQFSNIASSIGGAVIAITAVFGGGRIFSNVIGETKQWTTEAMKLARVLGITTESASVLNLALGDIYTDSETYLSASRMMTRQALANGDGFRKLGIDVRDAGGHLKPTGDLMQEVLEKINGLSTAQDRNAAGLMIFGRSWGEASKLLKLSAQVMDEAREKAESLHLIVGPEGVAATKAYKTAMNDVEDVVMGLKVQVGNEVLPSLTELGVWFSEVAPPAVDIMVKAFKAVGDVLSLTTVQIALAAVAFKVALLPALITAGTAIVAWVQTVQLQMHLASLAWRTGPAVSQFQALTSAVFGSINPWLLIGVAVVAAGIGLERWVSSASRAASAHRELAQQSLNNSQKFMGLSQEAERLDKTLNNSKATVEQKKKAQDQLAVTLAQLNTIYPGFNKHLRDEAGNQRSIAEAFKTANDERQKSVQLQIKETEAKLAQAKAQIGDRAASGGSMGALGNTPGGGLAAAFGWLQMKRAADAGKAATAYQQSIESLLSSLKALQGESAAIGENALGFGDDSPKVSPFEAISKAWDAQKAKLISQGAEAEAYGRDAELAFWRGKLASLKQGGEDWIKAQLKINDLRQQLDAEGQERRKAKLADELQAAKEDSNKRVAIAQSYYVEMKTAHGDGHKLTLEAHKKLEEEQQRHSAKMKELAKLQADGMLAARLGELDQEEESDRIRVQLGEISAQDALARMQAREDQKFALKKAALQKELGGESDVIKRQEILNQIEALEREHSKRTNQIKEQALVEQQERIDRFLQPLTQSFNSSLDGLLAGTMSWASAMSNVWKGLGSMVDQAVSQMVMTWVTGQMRMLAVFVMNKAKEAMVHKAAQMGMTAATGQGVLARVALETWGAIKSVALAIWTGLKWVAIQAYKAAAGAYSAIVSIPYVGPFLAPVAAGVALAAVIGMSSKLMSAAGGYDIPAGVNPLVQAHAREMILPAKHADVIRGLAEGGGTGGSQQPISPVFHIQTMDARGVKQFLMDNQGALAQVLGEMARNGRKG